MATVYATGKRKSAVAKVWVKPGSGKIVVNGMDLNTFALHKNVATALKDKNHKAS